MYSHAGTAPVPRKLAHWHNWHLNGNFVPSSIMSNTILVLSARDVEMVSASFSPQDVQSVMAHVFYTLSHVTDPLTGVAAPHRTAVDMLSHRALFMPARIAGIGTAIKVVSVPSVPGDTRGPEVPPSSTWLFSYLRRFLIQHVGQSRKRRSHRGSSSCCLLC